jgi:threonine dehydrogenase-like Zn-dependent dehydrogenase
VPMATSGRSGCQKGRRTSVSSSSPTSCPQLGRRSSTPTYPDGGSVTVFGLGPIGQLSSRVAAHRGARVIGVDLERLEMARRHGIDVLDLDEHDDLAESIRVTGGRGTDSMIDAVGMEAHGNPAVEARARDEVDPGTDGERVQ